MRAEIPNSEVTAAGPAVASDKVLSEVVQGIKAAQSKHGFALAAEIGHLVVERLYGGDLQALRSRGEKDASLRKLAQHAELPMSATSLYYALGVYEFLMRRPGIEAHARLTPTHVRAVLALPASDQGRLLQLVEKRSLSVAQLETEVRKLRRQRAKGGGRHPLPPFVKSIHALGRFVHGAEVLFGGLDAIGQLDPSEVRALSATLSGLQLKCDELQQALAARATEASLVATP